MKKIKKCIRKLAVVGLTCTMLMALASCEGKVHITTGFTDKEIMEVSGNIIPMSLAKILLAEERNIYTSQYGSDIWQVKIDDKLLVDQIKENIKLRLTELVTISLLAEEKGVVLSNSEDTAIEKAAKVYVSGLSDEEKASIQATWQDVKDLYRYFLLASKLYESVADSVDIEISDEDARVIKVQYCYVKKGDGAKNRIDNAYSQLLEGKSFGLVAKEFSDDETYECEIGREVFPEKVDAVAFEMENGDMSTIIELEDGYYIVKCLNQYIQDKTEINKKEILDKYKESAFMDIYKPYIDKQIYEYNDKDYNNIDIETLVLDNNNLYGVFETYMYR